MSSPIVEIQNVHKLYGTFTALQDVNLSIAQGEIVTLLGPSGCGKSTLMRMVAGFEDPTKGTIRIAGSKANGTTPDKRPVNMVFQRYALFPHLDVFDNIAFGLRVKGLKSSEVKEKVQKIISVVQLEQFKHRFIHELSGGQCQRVALARALVNEPQVLLLDEPLAALDLKIRQHMLSEMKRIHDATGAAFLYVTHDQDEALFLSNRIVLMEKGKILQIDNPQNMYRRPKSLFAAKFLGETNIITATVEGVNAAGVRLTTAGGHQFEAANSENVKPGQGVTVSLRPESITLQPDSLGYSGQTQTVNAVCQKSTFMGSRTFLEFALGADQVVKVQCPGAAETPAVGTKVNLYWRSEDVIVLPA